MQYDAISVHNLILTASNPHKYHSFSSIFHFSVHINIFINFKEIIFTHF